MCSTYLFIIGNKDKLWITKKIFYAATESHYAVCKETDLMKWHVFTKHAQMTIFDKMKNIKLERTHGQVQT